MVESHTLILTTRKPCIGKPRIHRDFLNQAIKNQLQLEGGANSMKILMTMMY